MQKARLILIILMHCFLANAQNDCSPVVKLKSMYSGDNKVKLLIDSMLPNVRVSAGSFAELNNILKFVRQKNPAETSK